MKTFDEAVAREMQKLPITINGDNVILKLAVKQNYLKDITETGANISKSDISFAHRLPTKNHREPRSITKQEESVK